MTLFLLTVRERETERVKEGEEEEGTQTNPKNKVARVEAHRSMRMGWVAREVENKGRGK